MKIPGFQLIILTIREIQSYPLHIREMVSPDLDRENINSLRGDRVQVFYSSDREQYVSLLSIDETGVVSFYHPDQSSENCSVLTRRGEGIAFEGSILFDIVSGNELVVAVFSESPLKTEDVKRWMAANYASDSDLQSLSKKIEVKSLAKKATIQMLLLKKG